MAIQLACDACGKFFRTTDNFAGKKLRCKCGQVLRHLGPYVEEPPPNPLMSAETVVDQLVVAPAVTAAPTIPQQPIAPPMPQQAVVRPATSAGVSKPAPVVAPPAEEDDAVIIGLRDPEPPPAAPVQVDPAYGINDDDLDDLAALAPDPATVRRPAIGLSDDDDTGAYDFAPPKPHHGPSAAKGHSTLASAVSRRR